MRYLMLPCLLLVLGLGACSDEEHGSRAAGDVSVPLADVPEVVMAAAKAAVDRFVPTSAEQETEDGAVIYDIEGTADGKRFEIEVSAAGRVLDIESGPDDDDEDDGDGDDEEEELQGDD